MSSSAPRTPKPADDLPARPDVDALPVQGLDDELAVGRHGVQAGTRLKGLAGNASDAWRHAVAQHGLGFGGGHGAVDGVGRGGVQVLLGRHLQSGLGRVG